MRVLLCLLLLAMAAGCVKFERPSPQRDSFVLEVSRPDPPGPASAVMLQVRRLKVSPRFAGTGFVYRTGELQYEADFYNRFLTPPGSLLTEELRRWLAAAGLSEPSGPATVDLVVEGEVPALYGDFRGRAQAVLEIRFQVLDARTARGELLLDRSYRQTVPLAQNAPGALVQGFNEALRRILVAFEADLQQVLPR